MREFIVIFLLCIVGSSILNQFGGLAAIVQGCSVPQGLGQIFIGAAVLLLLAKGVTMYASRRAGGENAGSAS